MSKPLEGVRVVEVAGWTFVPAAGAVLADLGADVVKVEPPTGDPQRGLRNLQWFDEGAVNPFVEIPNHGKRSITLDLTSDAGRSVLRTLCERSDVFLTSYLPRSRGHLKIDVGDVRSWNEDIIYVRGSGWGTRGPKRESRGYDLAAGWAGSGLANWVPSASGEPHMQPRGFFDLIGANTIAGAVCAALFLRERTGNAEVVDVSLMASALWGMGLELMATRYIGPYEPDRRKPGNVLSNSYETRDGRWIYLVCLQSDRYWDEFCALIDRPELAVDPRFVDSRARYENTEVCVRILDAEFAQRDLGEWAALLRPFTGVWAPALTLEEVWNHEQLSPNGYLAVVDSHDGSGSFQLVAPPQQFGEEAPTPRGPAPKAGEHSQEILRELGYAWTSIEELTIDGAFG